MLIICLYLITNESKAQNLFGTEQIISTNVRNSHAAHAADLDRDGDIDVLSISAANDKVVWYKNDGNNNFSAENIISTNADRAWFVYPEDLDEDGDIDVLSSSVSDNKVAWYENDGDGNFSAEIIISTNAEQVLPIHTADLDGDGDTDVLSGSGNIFDNNSKIVWYENDGNGSFSTEIIISTDAETPRSIYTADIDRDGNIDVISGSIDDHKIAWYKNDGNGNFGTEIIISTNVESPYAIYAADLDRDGDSDVLCASGEDDKIVWYENDGTGNFNTENIISLNSDFPFSIYAADLDGDGDWDVLSGSSKDGKIIWYENDGSGNFSTENSVSVYAEYRIFFVNAVDLDGDGDLDILSALQNKIALQNGKIVWYENLSPCSIPDVPSTTNTLIHVCGGEINDEIFYAHSLEQAEIAWFNADTSASPIAYGEEVVFENAGTYYAAAYSVANGDTCFSPKIRFTIEERILNVSNSGDVSILHGESAEISAQASSSIPNAIFSIEWNGNNLSNYSANSSVANPNETETYIATFTDENGCSIATELMVTVKPFPNDTVLIWMPNAFSPNNDGVNDYFHITQSPLIKSVKLSIYNRWGKKVFESKDDYPKWDGYFEFELQEMGFYVYVYEYIRSDSVQIIKTGNVFLMH